VRITVPGNLLLVGEYAVLEKGGLGIALAPAERVVVTAVRGRKLAVVGKWPGGGERWEDGSDRGGVISSAAETCREWLSARGAALPSDVAVHVDSTALFDAGGRKRGYGSSAAVTVGVVASLLRLSGLSESAVTSVARNLALKAHRRAQGGRGSGYDVFTSHFGGVGLFRGGPNPGWRALSLPWLPALYVYQGESSVATGSAIGCYEKWKSEHPRGARAFLRASNRAVRRFAAAGSWAEAAETFLHLRSLNIALGREIGVDAEIRPPAGEDLRYFKALGAGNEIGVCMEPPGASERRVAESEELERLEISERGVEWEW